MRLILSRHGNTFGPKDKVVWTGKNNDIPLVEKGIKQAKHLASVLVKHSVQPSAIYCSPLQRTHKYAQIIIEQMQLFIEPIIDHRLNELDYGQWSGLTNEEVIMRFGKEALDGWNGKTQWPLKGDWGSTEHSTIQEVHAFAKEIANTYDDEQTILIISSNGRLRYFLTLVPNEFEKRVKNKIFKMSTGHIGTLACQNNSYTLVSWNINPDEMSFDR